MVDEIRAEIRGTKHLRAVLEPRADSSIRRMAADADGGLARQQSANWRGADRTVFRRLSDCALQHVSDQSLRAVRAASGREPSRRQPDAGAAFPYPALLQIRAAPDLPGIYCCLL